MNLSSLRCLFPAVVDTLPHSCLRNIFRNRLLAGPSSSVRCRWLSSSEPQHTQDISDTERTEQLSENDVVSRDFVNRNPRNLEFMGIAKKRKGWRYQYPTKEYYHRVVFEGTGRHITARVEHISGTTVVSASTRETAIAKHLHSPVDTAAAINIARVLAQRCRECGITSMRLHEPEQAATSSKFQAFHEALDAGGICLAEPEEVRPPYVPGIDYDNQEDMEELTARQKRATRLGHWSRMYLRLRAWQRGNRFRKKVT